MELVTEWSMSGFRGLEMAGKSLASEECGISETSTSASMLGPPERKGRLKKATHEIKKADKKDGEGSYQRRGRGTDSGPWLGRGPAVEAGGNIESGVQGGKPMAESLAIAALVGSGENLAKRASRTGG
jgi:hypothetical protein